MIKVAIVGVGGRMGSLIAKLISQTQDITVVAASEHPDHPLVGKILDLPGKAKVVASHQLDLSGVQVVVDFTVPGVCLQTLEKAKIAKCAVVSGTTGLTPEQLQVVEDTAKDIPVLFSPNMSLGVNLFFRTIETVSKQLGDHYDVEVVEIHHRHKKDAPSGTAKRILELLKRPAPCHSLRIGEVVGEHQVHFAGQGERITLTHQAESRETFASGALVAIRFICDKTPRLYTMFDVLDNLE